jgi:hypothetical protein
VIDIAERAGLASTVSLITGFPEESREDLRETVRVFMHAACTPKSGPQINLLAPLANTPLHLKYRHEMTLSELCSDISHQSRRQHPEDRELIRRYPEIFPNFYLLPTPELDRAELVELREFLMSILRRMRWVSCAVHQAADMLDVFVDWVHERKRIAAMEVGPDLRQYYGTARFQQDFIEFLKRHSAGRDWRTRLLIEFYELLGEASSPDEQNVSELDVIACDEPMCQDDVALRAHASRMVELEGDLQEVVDAIRTGRVLEPKRYKHFYAVSQKDTTDYPGYEVPKYLAKLIGLCDGQRTVGQIMELLCDEIEVTPEEARRPVYEALFENARAEGLIAIYRSASEADDSHDGLVAMAAYSEMRAAASRQNQASIQWE